MPFVVDASTAISWILKETGPANRPDLYGTISDAGVVVPAIWSLEVTNGILQALKRKRLTEFQLAQYLPILDALRVEYEDMSYARALSAVFQLALEHGLTSYDASYVELARRRGIPLVTGDDRMATAARNMGVELFP